MSKLASTYEVEKVGRSMNYLEALFGNGFSIVRRDPDPIEWLENEKNRLVKTHMTMVSLERVTLCARTISAQC